MVMAATDMVSTGKFSEVIFHLEKCLQKVASVLFNKNSHFWVQTLKVRPPDDMLTIH
jgi:hypothetical protein